MAKVVIGIHGLSNKPEVTELYQNGWFKAMKEGLEKNQNVVDKNFNFEGVYWAGHNYSAPDTDGDTYRPAEPDALKQYKDRRIDDIVRIAEDAGGNVLDWFKNTLNINRTADRVLEGKLPDLHRYYEENGKYEELTGLLAAALEKYSNHRIMLIGHSMGSIIAYDALRDIGAQSTAITIEHFVTIGSPLGMPHVIKKIIDRHGTPRTPSIVKRWSNFSDRRDPVAMDEHLGDDYKANTAGVSVIDDLVLNDWRVKNGVDIFHKSYGYLRTPEFSKVLAEFI